MISDLNIDDELFVLDRPTSIALLRHYPLQVGRDPIVTVHDLHPRHLPRATLSTVAVGLTHFRR